MSIITLKGVSKKGKQRIKQHGNKWKIIKKDKVAFNSDINFLIESLNTNNRRWIKIQNDNDFEIIKK